MSNVLIVYGSTTGNTAEVAEALGREIHAAGIETTVKGAADVSFAGLCNGYDAVLFGCSAWGTDEVELQEDFQPLFDHFDQIGVAGVQTGCFATGLSSFEHFCGAVDVLEARLQELGGVQMVEGLKLDGTLAENEGEVRDWGEQIVKALQGSALHRETLEVLP